MKRLVAPGLLAGVAVLLWFFAPERELDLMTRTPRLIGLSDRLNDGHSRVHLQASPGSFRFQYRLRPGFPYPWAGMNLLLADSTLPPLDLGAWRAIRIHARTEPSVALRLQILSDDLPEGATGRDSIHLIYHFLEFTPENKALEIPWKTFTVPSWWRGMRHRDDLQRLDLLDRVRSMEIHAGSLGDGLDSAEVELKALLLVGPSPWARGLALLLGIGAAILFFRSREESPSETSPEPGAAPSSLSGSPVALDDPRSRKMELVLEMVKTHFADPELSLEKLSSQAGLSPRLVATLLKEATGLHFKGALNHLRLEEAGRLLRETRGSISEICFAVGYQNPSHFGRAFRERFGVSPSEWRQNETLEPPPDDSAKPA
ncbi:MAG: helix-turn-helix transcriptional regulator [Fibrobacteria bacterium]|nr:helix-turn-helix transcriptional regulator [Fibrobacteria bacterium]